ncbi:cas scaffolding protein family member 4 isoform 2-T2 [Lycaon pictus]
MKGAGVMDGAPKTLLARALYDNHPDCSYELAFCRGDILTILEQDVPESEGWWKCLLHGRQGLAPANRLQILPEAPAERPCPPFLRGLEEGLASSKETYQALFTIPRPARASLPTLPSQVYDVPAQSWGPPALKKPEKQQLYDIPASPKRAALGSMTSPPGRQSAAAMSAIATRQGSYSTLPSPQKSEWIYDTPVSPEKADGRNASLGSFVEESEPHTPPRYMSSFQNPPNSRARSLNPHLHKNVPMQKKLSLPEIPCYKFLAPRDTIPLDESAGYKVPSSFLIPRVEQQNTKPNIYDTPKVVAGGRRAATELGTVNGPSENTDRKSTWPSGQAPSLSPDPDRLSISSCDSRASVVSSCSSTSTDSSSSSCSEDSGKELLLDPDLARETVAALQQQVAGSVAGLMLFVSRKWRFRDYLEANLGAIRTAAHRVEESLRAFLEFARGVQGSACNLSDTTLQARIRDQLQTISNSYQILLGTKESLDSCNWSLEVLVTDKVQNNPDDLERFVMVARMVPEDIKRFASIVIANGKLLFRQNCEKEDTLPMTPHAPLKLAKCLQLPQREIESYQSSVPVHKQKESVHSPELLKKNGTIIREPNPSSLSLSQQNPEKRFHLSEHCRLYFGALFKAIGVFNSTLSNSQPPEIFITQSKLVIMVGQKLVDTLCKETQERDVRNEILCGSSHLCSLLKNLALATKHAVLKYPSPAALGHLQAEAQKLEQHTRQFRGTLE